jgi:hypothetical protein
MDNTKSKGFKERVYLALDMKRCFTLSPQKPL